MPSSLLHLMTPYITLLSTEMMETETPPGWTLSCRLVIMRGPDVLFNDNFSPVHSFIFMTGKPQSCRNRIFNNYDFDPLEETRSLVLLLLNQVKHEETVGSKKS